MAPLGLHHVSINVDDVGASLKFYVDILGLGLRGDRPDFNFDGAWLDAGSQQIHLIAGLPPEDRGQHFALAYGDLAEVSARLRQHGFDVSEPVAVGRSLQAFVRDPAGNRVELHQPGQSRAAAGPARAAEGGAVHAGT